MESQVQERDQGGGECHVAACRYCKHRVVVRTTLPEGWGQLGGQLACRQCLVIARVLAS